MILCDLFPRFKRSEEVATIVWLVFHVFGIATNLYAYYVLKKRWNAIGNVSVILATSILANVSVLFVHLYLPINSLLRTLTGREWSLGPLGCSFLPALTNLTQAIALLALVAVAFQKYLKKTKQRQIRNGEAEYSMVLMFVTASLIVVPEFCQCGVATEALTSKGLCFPTWQLSYGGRLYQTVRVLLQYVIPLALASNAFFKAHLVPRSGKISCIYRIVFIIVDCITGISLGFYLYFFPVEMIINGELNAQGHATFPSIAAMMKTMDLVAIFLCVAGSFEIIDILKDDAMVVGYDHYIEYNEKPDKELKHHGKVSSDVRVAAKVTSIFKPQEKSKDDLIERLIKDEPLKLKNEIIV